MASLYPSLHEKFQAENICPICMMEMTGTPKFMCDNNHILCHRCKPYYYACPTCRCPLTTEISPEPPAGEYHMPPAMHYMPHPYPPYPPTSPSAPFLDHERARPWCPSPPTEDQQLHPCQYSYLGCYAQIPEHLRTIHEERCQFRPNLEEEHLPTDLQVDEGTLEDCKYEYLGCNVRLPIWRKVVHEELCIYKDKLQALDGLQQQFAALDVQQHHGYEDPEEMVECRFNKYGCQVKMPRRRKETHESICNHARDNSDNEEEYVHVPEPEYDPEEQLPCRWADYGCQVEPKRYRKERHEEICNYRREPCQYAEYGCSEYVEPARKFAHERNCPYA